MSETEQAVQEIEVDHWLSRDVSGLLAGGSYLPYYVKLRNVAADTQAAVLLSLLWDHTRYQPTLTSEGVFSHIIFTDAKISKITGLDLREVKEGRDKLRVLDLIETEYVKNGRISSQLPCETTERAYRLDKTRLKSLLLAATA